MSGEKVANIPVNELVLDIMPRLLSSSAFTAEQTPVLELRHKIIDACSQWRFYNANNMDLQQIRFSEPKLGPADEGVNPVFGKQLSTASL